MIFYALTLMLSIASTVNGITPTEMIIIRKTTEADFKLVTEQGINTFMSVYNPATQEEKDNLKMRYTLRIHSERTYFLQHPEMLSFVAWNGETLVGFFSAQKTTFPRQLYLRHVFVTPAFQKQGIFKKFLKEAFKVSPDTDHIVLLTNKKNQTGQAVYESLKGRKSENPDWIDLLDNTLNKNDYIGYSINKESI